jgi:hypothetical protein
MVGFGYIIVNTTHKGDNKDNNNNNYVFPRDMVCLGNICINILHKGAKDDDDDGDDDDDDDDNDNNNNNRRRNMFLHWEINKLSA